MSTSTILQLEAFAYWRRRLLGSEGSSRLFAIDDAATTRLMEQAVGYVIDGRQISFFVEAPLAGEPAIDLSAQYFVRDFLDANPLVGRVVAPQGELFHLYAVILSKLKPALLHNCTLYLEADTSKADVKDIAYFINLAGDYVVMLLPVILTYQGKYELKSVVARLLEQGGDLCRPWHFGFMDSRESKPLRLVLALTQGIKKLSVLLERLGTTQLPPAAYTLLKQIEALNGFTFMLDLDVLVDGSLGDTVGVELIPRYIAPIVQQDFFAGSQFTRLCALLSEARVADERLAALPEVVFNEELKPDRYIYSRLSHFKLRWQQGRALPAKVYLQMRMDYKQETINQALGYRYDQEMVAGEERL